MVYCSFVKLTGVQLIFSNYMGQIARRLFRMHTEKIYLEI